MRIPPPRSRAPFVGALFRPACRPLTRQQEDVGGAVVGSELAGHGGEENGILPGGTRIEEDGEALHQGRAIRAFRRRELRRQLGRAAALEPHADGAVQPAGDLAQLVDQFSGEKKAFVVRLDS